MAFPISDTFRRIFEKLDPTELSECLVNWLDAELPRRCTIAIDGKTIRETMQGCDFAIVFYKFDNIFSNNRIIAKLH